MTFVTQPPYALNVEYVVTADDPFGEPWPPDGSCSIVRRTSKGFTLWRRLFLTSSPATDRRTGRGITHARHEYTAMDMKKYASKGFVNVEYIENHGPIEGMIERVELGQFDKPNITLNTGHRFSLNKTNVGTLMREFGEDSDTWLGQPIRLGLGEIKFQGTMQTAVVVESLISNEGKGAKPKPEKPKADFDDSADIPF